MRTYLYIIQIYLLEDRPLVLQAPTPRWVFQEPICINVPAGIFVRGWIMLQWIFFEDSFNAFAHFIDGWFTSTTTHTVLSVEQFLPKNGMTLMLHPPCSSHLNWSDFSLFVSPNEKVLKGKHFANVEEVKQKIAEALKGIKISEFKNFFKQWKKCLNRCSASNGEYFESDWSLNI